MKIMFDSNVWQNVVIPKNYISDSFYLGFLEINNSIKEKLIEPFISEGIFTLEAIKKIERQDFYSSKIGKIDASKAEAENKSININFTIGSQKGIDFDERPILKMYFDEAIKLGFKIVSLPRLGGMKNKEIDRYLYFPERLDRFTIIFKEVVDRIEAVGAGMSQIREIGMKYDLHWLRGLKNAEQEANKISKAAAEWSDGDAVALSIALDCNYFCTRDLAKNAGKKSVLSKKNLEWLERDFNFKTIRPEELLDFLE